MKKIAICMSLLIGQAWALSCTTPVTISEPGREVSTPKVAINEEGEAFTAWVSKNLEKKEETLFAASRDGEKKWSSAAISEVVADVHLHDLYMDTQGNRFVFWNIEKEDSEGNGHDYYQFAKKEKSQAWTPAMNVLNPEDNLKYPKVTFDSQGNVLLLSDAEYKNPKDAWKKIYSIVSIFYSHQKGEVKKTEIAQTEGYSSSIHFLKNQTGKFFSWWEDSTYRGYQTERMLKGAWLLDDGSWSDPDTVVSFGDSTYISGRKGVMNSKGDLVTIWERSPSTDNKIIQVATCEDGEWSEPLILDASEKYYNQIDPLMNDAGYIAACWSRREKGKEAVYFADKPVGQPWSSPIALSDRVKEVDIFKIAMDDQGNILMISVLKEGRKEVPCALYKPFNQEWIAPVRLSEGVKVCDNLRVETNHQGYFVVLWNQIERKQVSIQGAALSTATKEWTSATLSPPGQDCGNFKIAFNKKGQGIIAWQTTWDQQDFFVQVAELNVN